MNRSFIISAILLALLTLTLGQPSFAQFDDDDDSASSGMKGSGKAPQRQYPGGRDEQDLTVQDSLPQPTRNIDAAPAPAHSSESND